MRVFVNDVQSFKSHGGNIVEILSGMGVEVIQYNDETGLDLEKIDAVIINGEKTNESIAYILAISLAKQKPILCLVNKGRMIQDAVRLIKENKDLSKKLTIIFFNSQTLKSDIYNFIQKFEGGTIKEVPSIKFTLRITPSMERYLQWKSQQTKESKADFLRKAIKTNIIDKDSEYHENL